MSVDPKTLVFSQPGVFGFGAAQSDASMSAFQANAFQAYVFQIIPNLLQTDPDWLVESKKRKWTVTA